MRVSLLLTVLLMPVLGAAPRAAFAVASALSDMDRARVDSAMNHLVEVGVPGIELAVVKDGTVAYVQGYGLANLKTRRPVTATTPMEIGSLTMQFTAAAILQLVEVHRISLDDRLGKYVPEYVLGRDITLRQLLSLQGGVPDYFWQDEVSGRIFAQKPSVDRVLNLFEDHKLEFAPGTRWAFNNSEYFLLGQVIERVTGMRWETYVKRNVFARAGMTHTTTIAHESELSDFPVGYWRMHGVIGSAPRPYDLWGLATFNVVSTVSDMVKWNLALQAGEIVSRDDVALMMNPETLKDGGPTPSHSGMAFHNTALEERPMVWNDGGTLGFTGINAIFPEERLQLVVLSNANITIVYPGPLLNAAFFALHPDAEARRYSPVAGEDEAITGKIRSDLEAIRAGTLAADQATDEFRAGADDIRQFLDHWGDIKAFIFKGRKASDNRTSYDYRTRFARGDVLIDVVLDPSGKVADINIGP